MDIITDFINILENYTSIYFIVLVLISAFAAKLADWILSGIILRFAKQTETTFDDKLIDINSLGEAMYIKITRDPKLTVSLKSDENSLMETLTDIHTQLKKAQALKLNYSAMSQIEN